MHLSFAFLRALRGELLVLLLAACSNALAAAPNADDLVGKVQARYDATKDFTADVKQEATIASLNKTVSASGTVAFKKPGKMRWELTDGDPQVIVADGSAMWVYRPRDSQVVKMPFNNVFRSSTPLSFLSGVGRIKDDFTASLDGEGDGVLYLMLVPRHDSTEVGKLRLTVSRDTYDIRGAEVTDPLGNLSRLRFDNLQRNVGLEDKRFTFEVPPGVDVVTAPQAP